MALLAFSACSDNPAHLPDAPPGTPDAPPAAPAQLKLATASADFGSVVVNQTSASMSLTVANVGASVSGSITVALSGGQSSNFTIGSTDCTTLAPAATCTIQVTF